MKYILQACVFVLMVSIGMALKPSDLMSRWRQQSLSDWLRLLLATFILPPVMALLLHRFLHLSGPEAIGLFMVGVAPGAPLLTRNLGKHGYDMKIAASYQVWGAMLTPIMIPVVVALAGKLYDRDVWISPLDLLLQIVEKQFIPLLLGMALVRFVPAFTVKVQPILNVVGNAVLTIIMVLVLVKMGPRIVSVLTWRVPLAALLLAVGCATVVRLFTVGWGVERARTIAISNANRHVGLALLLSGKYLNHNDVIPAVACYALVVALLMFIYPHLFPAKVAAA